MGRLPWSLTFLRLALAPVLVGCAWWAPQRAVFGVCLVLGFVSDVFDGILARRLGVATPALRRFDSVADTVFYGGATVAVWHLHRAALVERAAPLAGLAALEVARYAFDWIKFRREAAYHMWSSKAWGIALFAGFVSLLAYEADTAWVDAAIIVGIVADLEGLAISAVLPHACTDVASVVHALRIARDARDRSTTVP